jgi:hypothetical protein
LGTVHDAVLTLYLVNLINGTPSQPELNLVSRLSSFLNGNRVGLAKQYVQQLTHGPSTLVAGAELVCFSSDSRCQVNHLRVRRELRIGTASLLATHNFIIFSADCQYPLTTAAPKARSNSGPYATSPMKRAWK